MTAKRKPARRSAPETDAVVDRPWCAACGRPAECHASLSVHRLEFRGGRWSNDGYGEPILHVDMHFCSRCARTHVKLETAVRGIFERPMVPAAKRAS